ncbi:right-handed parallel beta-helix repeat-containing protein [Inquilinus sp. YAF38]|uniref:hypothetical protein n=1 Tax=Inquilinus sp. YAF38 TaxID=3233084 RepID=UPI003F91A3C7
MGTFRVDCPADLQKACDQAKAGDEILIAGGVYDRPSLLEGRSGEPGRPIVIRAADEGWICGGQWPKPPRPGNSMSRTDFAFLRVVECAHVVIEGLRIRDCWPVIFWIENTRHLTIRGCSLQNGTHAIFAKGSEASPTSHLLIEGNRWQQDTQPGHPLWTTIDWAQAHGEEGPDSGYSYFNGAFLSAKAIRGQVVIRRNCITDAYNGVRLKSGNADVPAELAHRVNADIHIVDNDFVRIRDNPVEIERSAYNWHVRHNRMLDCHAWFSFDGAGGGFWYVYGNTGRFESRQGLPHETTHTMGRVLKLSYEQYERDPASERVPDFPWFVFNNSWHLRCPIIGGADISPSPAEPGPDFTARLEFFNNAFGWCSPDRDGAWVCETIELIRNFDMRRSIDTRFDHSISDRSDAIDYFQRSGWGEAHGLVVPGPVFEDAAAGKLGLAAGSPGIGSGWARAELARARPGHPAALRLQADGTVNRGAVQEYGLIEVPELEAETTALLAEIGAGA